MRGLRRAGQPGANGVLSLQWQYIESHGINLQFSNGIEFSPDRLYSIALLVPLYFDVPSQGDMEFAAGMGVELVLHPTERLTLRLGNQWRDGLGTYDIDARRTSVAVFWQF